MGGHRDALIRNQSLTSPRLAIAITIAFVVFMCSIFAFLNPHAFPFTTTSSFSKANSLDCNNNKQLNITKNEVAMLKEKNAELKKQLKELNEKLMLAENRTKIIQPKAGPFGTVKALRTNPIIKPDKSVNPRLANILEKVAINKELILVLANINVKEMLELQISTIKKVGIPNYLVVALDDEIQSYCESNSVAVYRPDPNDSIDAIAKNGSGSDISGLKFRILREFLQLGYSILLSDVDIIYLKNPFYHLYRDSDVESMSDGHDYWTAYGYVDVFDDPTMGWSQTVHTIRIWVYNSGFFYIRPTIPSIELLDRVTDRLSKARLWDQTVFNEELFYPSFLGYKGLYASKRTMDFYSFMNSKVLFKFVRKNPDLRKMIPVIIHLNYHPDKLPRMKAVIEYYVNGNQSALDPFPDGTPRF